MAMGLGFLGRGNSWQAVRTGAAHVMGAVLGGAAAGGLIGLTGTLLGLDRWRPMIIALSGLTALLAAISQ